MPEVDAVDKGVLGCGLGVMLAFVVSGLAVAVSLMALAVWLMKMAVRS